VQSVPVLKEIEVAVERIVVPRVGARWQGCLLVRYGSSRLCLLMPASIARWLAPSEKLILKLLREPDHVDGVNIAERDSFVLWRIWEGERVQVWPPWKKEVRLVRSDPIRGKPIYEYVIVAREAVFEEDYQEIVALEQYHYASKEEIVAIWKCPICGRYFQSNVQPSCPKDDVPAKLQEIRGSLPSSRFLILELAVREPHEPRVVGYVRVDTPIPLMHRRIVINGAIKIEKMIREKVFPKDWFHPTFWPLVYTRRLEIIKRYKQLAGLYGSKRIARAIVGEEIAEEALCRANTAAFRIARVVIHPDYRGDGLGVLAVKLAVQWIAERRIPEMKRKKHVVETIAQMARYNPFFEKAGFVYMWDTASGRPVLMYPLTEEARKKIEEFLKTDPIARRHGGKLFVSRFGTVEKLSGPIVFENVTKKYRSVLDVSKLPKGLQDVLRAFGAERRVVERYVLRDVNLRIEPGEVVAVVGASGAGKTTLLRLLIGAIRRLEDENYKPSDGIIKVPENAKVEYLLPGEHEPEFGEETILEHVSHKTGDVAAAVEVLNAVGLSDAIFYRAKITELSTGQKERAKLASLIASKPNLLVVDEFAAHLDPQTAQRVARKLSQLCRKAGITLVVATNRLEVLKALSPDKVVIVGYGTVIVKSFDEYVASLESVKV